MNAPRHRRRGNMGPRIARFLGLLLVSLSVVVLILGVIASISFASEYGWNGLGGVASAALWILLVSAVPAMMGWLLLRIAKKSGS